MTDARLRRHELGFLELVVKPTSEQLSEYYADKYYQSEKGNYRKSYPQCELDVIRIRVAHRAGHAARLRGTDAPGRLLDVGCGEGFVLADFAARGWQVEGIDHSIEGVATMNPDLVPHVHQGNLFSELQSRIAKCSAYELVWLGNVLEHVLDPVGLMQTLRRLVRPGGVLIVTVPNDGTAFHSELLADGAIPEPPFWIAIPDHISYFTADSLTRLAEATGWSCRDLQGDFPIDLYLAHAGSNYVMDRSKGPEAHSARLRLERHIGRAGAERANAFYSALAGVDLGRNITAYLKHAL